MKSLSVCLLSAMIVLFLPGCRDDSDPIRIGTNSWPPCEIWTIAKRQELFDSTPVDIIRFSTWTDNMSALYKGDIDITHATYFNAVYFSDKGEDGVIILSLDTINGGDGFVVRKDLSGNGRADPDLLRGSRLAVEVNTDEHFLLKKALEKYGLEESDFEIVSMTSEEAADAFIEGTVDGAFVYEPFLSSAAAAGGGEIIWTTSDLPGYMIDVLVVRREVLNRRNSSIKKIVNAWYDAQDYISSNPDNAFEVMAANENISAEDYRAFYNSFTFFSREDNVEIFSSDSFTERLNEMSMFLKQHNAISTMPDIEELYSDKIIRTLR